MPRVAIETNNRLALRIRPSDKALLMRAVTLEGTDLTAFILKNALKAAKTVIETSEHISLSHRDSLAVLQLLENPPPPNQKLIEAAKDLIRDI